MTRRVILDCSGYQPAQIDFARIKRESGGEVVGVILKASEGQWPGTNPNLESQYACARRDGMATGFYLFDHTSVDPTTEANVYLSKVAGKAHELGHWLDFEANDGGLSPQGVQIHVLAILGRLNAAYPGRVGVYSAPWAWNPWTGNLNAAQYPLWLAGYTQALPPSPAYWGRPLLWQMTDSYPTYFGGCDASVFLGNDADWQHLTGTRQQTPGDITTMAASLPNITANDHTHPKSLAFWLSLLKLINPGVDVSTDRAALTATEQFRMYFHIAGDAPGRIGPNMWAAAIAMAVHPK